MTSAMVCTYRTLCRKRTYATLSRSGILPMPSAKRGGLLHSSRTAQRQDSFRNKRRNNTSRPPSMHVDDYYTQLGLSECAARRPWPAVACTLAGGLSV